MCIFHFSVGRWKAQTSDQAITAQLKILWWYYVQDKVLYCSAFSLFFENLIFSMLRGKNDHIFGIYDKLPN